MAAVLLLQGNATLSGKSNGFLAGNGRRWPFYVDINSSFVLLTQHGGLGYTNTLNLGLCAALVLQQCIL